MENVKLLKDQIESIITPKLEIRYPKIVLENIIKYDLTCQKNNYYSVNFDRPPLKSNAQSLFIEMRRSVANAEGSLWLFVSLNDRVVLDCVSWQLTCDSIAKVSRGEAVGYIIVNHIPVMYLCPVSGLQLLAAPAQPYRKVSVWVPWWDEHSPLKCVLTCVLLLCGPKHGKTRRLPWPMEYTVFLDAPLPVFCYDVTT